MYIINLSSTNSGNHLTSAWGLNIAQRGKKLFHPDICTTQCLLFAVCFVSSFHSAIYFCLLWFSTDSFKSSISDIDLIF